MAPNTTDTPMRRALGILGVWALAVVTLGTGAMAQSPSPDVMPAPAVVSPDAASTTRQGRRLSVCPRVSRGDRWERRPGVQRGHERLRLRDLRRAIRGLPGRSDGRARRESRVMAPRLARGAARVASISAIDGTSLTLLTADGWSRTVDAASIPVTRGGEAISVADLRIGDRVLVRQRRAADGTWLVTRLRVSLTTVRGTVAAMTDTGFELTTRDGRSVSVRVSDATDWLLGCRVDPEAPLVIGSPVTARGVSAADGSLDATLVATAGRRALRGQVLPEPVPTPAPAISPAA